MGCGEPLLSPGISDFILDSVASSSLRCLFCGGCVKAIATIVGVRPQFIKVAPVSRALREVDGVAEVLVHTDQHFDANISVFW